MSTIAIFLAKFESPSDQKGAASQRCQKCVASPRQRQTSYHSSNPTKIDQYASEHPLYSPDRHFQVFGSLKETHCMTALQNKREGATVHVQFDIRPRIFYENGIEKLLDLLLLELEEICR